MINLYTNFAVVAKILIINISDQFKDQFTIQL